MRYYAQKILDTPDACPLGRGAEVFAGDAISASIRGLYQKQTDGSYIHIDGLGHTITKEPSVGADECGWRINEIVPLSCQMSLQLTGC